MKVGFTGSRNGMTVAQQRAFIDLAADADPRWIEFHHGDCVGSDEQALWLLVELGAGGVLHCHPPADDRLRAFADRHVELGQVVHPAKPYLARNVDIVDAAELLVACPAEAVEQQRGGTWSTVRYARSRKVPTVVILPDGTRL